MDLQALHWQCRVQASVLIEEVAEDVAPAGARELVRAWVLNGSATRGRCPDVTDGRMSHPESPGDVGKGTVLHIVTEHR